jgi:Tfp pilus assembly protein PilF
MAARKTCSSFDLRRFSRLRRFHLYILVKDWDTMTSAAKLLIIWLVLLLAACAGSVQRAQIPGSTPLSAPPVQAELFGAPVQVPEPAQLFELTLAQRLHFLEYFHDPVASRYRPHERIYRYLEGRLSDFRYDGSTLTAAEALAARHGNCMSLAILTTALAKLVDVEVDYQVVRNAPVYERRHGLVTVADHVRARLYDPTFVSEPGTVLFQRPHIVIDYFPEPRQRRGGRIDVPGLVGMFYVNLAGEALIARDFARSYWLLQAALEVAPASAEALNSMAVLHRMAGAPEAAEALFRHALTIHGDGVNLLGNLRNLLRDQGREQEADAVEQALLQLPNRDPYRMIEFGIEAHAAGRLSRALDFYGRAIVLAPYLHEAYWRKAVVHHELGQAESAEMLLQQAVGRAQRDSDRSLYEAKLIALGRDRRR